MSFVKENPSIISKDLEIVGNLISKGSIEIEGNIKGDIDAETISIREDGKVVGNVRTKVLNIKGSFNGIVNCEKVNISDTARVIGEINYTSLSADYGAHINCQLKRVDKSNQRNEISTKLTDVKVSSEIKKS